MNSMHSHQSPLRCPFTGCSWIFYHKQNLQIHIKRYHTDEPKISTKSIRLANGKSVSGQANEEFTVTCPWKFCWENQFESVDAMRYHLTTFHRKGRKHHFECHLCKAALNDKLLLQKHINSLHNSILCPFPACSKTFTWQKYLRRHINNIHEFHTKKKVFPCEMCPMKYYRKNHLGRHMAAKHGVGKTYSCVICQTTVVSSDLLRPPIAYGKARR